MAKATFSHNATLLPPEAWLVITRLGREGLPLDVHLRILCDALEGLHYAHELADYDAPLKASRQSAMFGNGYESL